MNLFNFRSLSYTVLEQFDEVSWNAFFFQLQSIDSYFFDAISLSIFNLDYKLINMLKNQTTNDFLFPAIFSFHSLSFLDIIAFVIILFIFFIVTSLFNNLKSDINKNWNFNSGYPIYIPNTYENNKIFVEFNNLKNLILDLSSRIDSFSNSPFLIKYISISIPFFKLIVLSYVLYISIAYENIIKFFDKESKEFYEGKSFPLSINFSTAITFLSIFTAFFFNEKTNIIYLAPNGKLEEKTIETSFKQFSYVFFFMMVQLFTTLGIFFWFDDILFLYTSIKNGSYFQSIEIFPLISFSIGIDEMFITFLGSLFILGFEDEEDLDIFLLDEEEGEMFEEGLVMPLFISFFEKVTTTSDWNGSVAGLYMKISTVFGLTCFGCLMGMVPYSDTTTSNFIFTFWLGVSIFISIFILMFRKKGVNHLFSLFMPVGCPTPLLLFLIPLEFISYIFRVISLSVRIFANMMAGHILLKVIAVFAWSGYFFGDFGWLLKRYLPLAVLGGMIIMESAIAIVQGYVFTLLTCLYVKDIFVSH